jgi:hypothetical protein
VWRVDDAEETFRSLRSDVQRAVRALEQRLEQLGCAAGQYRLSGAGVDKLCCTHLAGVSEPWRVIFGFPEPDEIAILQIGLHDERRGLDVYADMYGQLGLDEPPTGPRTKPPCCSDDPAGMVDLELFDRVMGRLEVR